MPIYELKCKNCGNIFEHMQFRSDETYTPCPSCGESNAERLLSAFSSISSSDSGFVNTPSSSCGPSCGSSGGFS